jgi:hypothetical protein
MTMRGPSRLPSIFVLVACGSCSTVEEAAPSRAVRPAPIAVDAGTDAAPTDPSCREPNGCFKCEPAHLDDFLNACTDRQCTPFDNTRLPLFDPSKPLPPVP